MSLAATGYLCQRLGWPWHRRLRWDSFRLGDKHEWMRGRALDCGRYEHYVEPPSSQLGLPPIWPPYEMMELHSLAHCVAHRHEDSHAERWGRQVQVSLVRRPPHVWLQRTGDSGSSETISLVWWTHGFYLQLHGAWVPVLTSTQKKDVITSSAMFPSAIARLWPFLK